MCSSDLHSKSFSFNNNVDAAGIYRNIPAGRSEPEAAAAWAAASSAADMAFAACPDWADMFDKDTPLSQHLRYMLADRAFFTLFIIDIIR